MFSLSQTRSAKIQGLAPFLLWADGPIFLSKILTLIFYGDMDSPSFRYK